MANENVYIALFIENTNLLNISSYPDVISLFTATYPNNKLVIEKYLVDGSINMIDSSLDDFILKYPSGKRVTISTTSSQLIYFSNYFITNNLHILNLSLSATSDILQKIDNVLTYAPFNQYASMNNFFIYQDYQMNYVHVLYQKNTPNDIFFNDYLHQIKLQAELLNIIVSVSVLEQGKYDYNIKPQSMVIILGNTTDITNLYVTPQFITNFPKKSFIILTDLNSDILDIFGNVPAIVQIPTNINFTTLSEKIYNSVKNNSSGFDYTVYPLYDVLFVLNDFTTNGLEITKENYISVNPYENSPAAWLLNSYLSPVINSAPYGKYQYTFTKDVIIGNNKSLFLQYYDGGQQQLPDSYSIFKIAGITPNNPSLIEYDDADYYEIYDSNNKLVCVKFNSNLTDFPIGKNMNIGKTVETRFLYKFNDEGYFIKLDRLFQYNELVPEVNSTMSKKTIKLKYMI
jgi:hypothetical protein